ncbi:DUF4424 family protein [Brevundimonas lenta]|uniref:DUF4424 domain-containing protein n=1 Tax=Brevundimonas lenta TaxID=424796 RepID=A0A7W6NRM0_9CAUL|nr:DUF4424 family protein [Brevundimonas lenta]MBB4084422.1 hypothetical protein [Brevundimonas lenta]
MNRATFLAATTALCLFVLAPGAPAAANDSVAVMGTGGLILQRTDGIVMRSEDLYVSAEEIRVRYRFFNRTDRDITTMVAFPMPDVVGRPEGDLGISQADPLRPTPFTTAVDGRVITTNAEQKAVLNGVDYTEMLRGLGVPIAPHLQEATEALAALPHPQLEMLIEMGLIEDRSFSHDGVVTVDFAPLWTLKTTHYWTQVFPAAREMRIDHRYTPAVGGSAGSSIAQADMPYSGVTSDYAARFCPDQAFVRGATRLRRRGQVLTETWVDYVLTTGANWAEPIGEFRLVIDKGSSRNLLTFCGEGVRRLDARRFEIRRENFTPTEDLSVLILTGVRPST